MMEQTTMEKAGNKSTLAAQFWKKIQAVRGMYAKQKKEKLVFGRLFTILLLPILRLLCLLRFLPTLPPRFFTSPFGFEHPYKTHTWFFKGFRTAIDEG